MQERDINLSIIAPRRMPFLPKLFEKGDSRFDRLLRNQVVSVGGGDLATALTTKYAKDPRHLILLRGFALQERPTSPVQPHQAPVFDKMQNPANQQATNNAQGVKRPLSPGSATAGGNAAPALRQQTPLPPPFPGKAPTPDQIIRPQRGTSPVCQQPPPPPPRAQWPAGSAPGGAGPPPVSQAPPVSSPMLIASLSSNVRSSAPNNQAMPATMSQPQMQSSQVDSSVAPTPPPPPPPSNITQQNMTLNTLLGPQPVRPNQMPQQRMPGQPAAPQMRPNVGGGQFQQPPPAASPLSAAPSPAPRHIASPATPVGAPSPMPPQQPLPTTQQQNNPQINALLGPVPTDQQPQPMGGNMMSQPQPLPPQQQAPNQGTVQTTLQTNQQPMAPTNQPNQPQPAQQPSQQSQVGHDFGKRCII